MQELVHIPHFGLLLLLAIIWFSSAIAALKEPAVLILPTVVTLAMGFCYMLLLHAP
jgi:hypothetical protein